MALQTVNYILYPAEPIAWNTASPTSSTVLTLAASTTKSAFIFRVPKTGTLDQVEFMLDTTSVNHTTSVIRVSLQDVSLTTGDPDGTQDQFRDIGTLPASDNWTAPGLMTSDGTDTGTKRSVTRGDLLAFVVEYQTFTAADSAVVDTMDVSTTASFDKLAYSDLSTAGVWAKKPTALPRMALKYNDGTYACPYGTWPIVGFAGESFTSTSSPDEVGTLFQLPFPCKVSGVFLSADLDGDADVVLYDTGGSAFTNGTVSLDKDVRADANNGWLVAMFAADITLLANTDYRMSLRPSTSTAVSLGRYTTDSTAIAAAAPGGTHWRKTSRTDAGSWTDVNEANRRFMGLIISALEDGTATATGGVSRGRIVNAGS